MNLSEHPSSYVRPTAAINYSLCEGGEERGRKHGQEGGEVSGLHKKAKLVLPSQRVSKGNFQRGTDGVNVHRGLEESRCPMYTNVSQARITKDLVPNTDS